MSADRKSSLRSELLAARRAVPDDVRRVEAQQISRHFARVVDGADVVCAYVPMGTEPGCAEWLDVLAGLCATVLLPVARTGPGGFHLPLQWGRYKHGGLVPGPFGTREPIAPWSPPSEVTTAQVVLVPALAVDRRGVRLGRGGGFYDRSLAGCGPDTRRVAVVRDDEVVAELPAEGHDVLMTHALTPGGIIGLSGMPTRR